MFFFLKLKLRTRQEQQEREEEQNNHVLMLRELQLLLANERAAKEDLEQQLEDARETVALKSVPDSKMEEYEQCIAELRAKVEEVQYVMFSLLKLGQAKFISGKTLELSTQ